MTPSHHPVSEILWSYAVGNCDAATGVLVATHLALCPRCRRESATMEAAAGAMFEAIEAAPVDDRTFNQVLARLDAPTPADNRPSRPPAPVNRTYPRPLRDYFATGEPAAWRRLTDGVETADVEIRAERRKIRLLRVQPGQRLPRHGHGGDEMTLVLAGGYRSEGGSFGRGDVECADHSTVHEPVADRDGPCICLTVTRGSIVPSMVLSWLTQRLNRLWA